MKNGRIVSKSKFIRPRALILEMTAKPVRAALFLVFFWAKNSFAQGLPITQVYRQNWQMLNPAAVDRLFFLRKTSKELYPSQFSLAVRGQQTGTSATPATGFLTWEG